MDQGALKNFAAGFFGGKLGGLDRLLRVFETAGIDKRSLSKPLEWFKKNKSFQEKNDAYIELALELSARAIEKLLESNSLAATEIDHLLFVSTTGLATPSIDARLTGRLGFRPNVRPTRL